MLALSASAAVQADDCTPSIESAWVRAAPPGAPSLAGYLVLKNRCAAAVEVVGVESLDFAAPMIHRTESKGGMNRMRPATDMKVAAGGELRFEPGGLHLMLMRPAKVFKDGDQVRLRLVLADGRRMFAEVPVRREAP